MGLNQKQLFIKRNFGKNAEQTAETIVSIVGLPKTEKQFKNEIYKSIMVFMSAAFEFEKIIIKNNADWDSREI